VWPLRRLSWANAEMASLHLIAPVITSAATVERDLGERPSAQRFPGGLLTRKRTEVQLLPRPPHLF
jgi:hypothetical protein